MINNGLYNFSQYFMFFQKTLCVLSHGLSNISSHVLFLTLPEFPRLCLSCSHTGSTTNSKRCFLFLLFILFFNYLHSKLQRLFVFHVFSVSKMSKVSLTYIWRVLAKAFSLLFSTHTQFQIKNRKEIRFLASSFCKIKTTLFYRKYKGQSSFSYQVKGEVSSR